MPANGDFARGLVFGRTNKPSQRGPRRSVVAWSGDRPVASAVAAVRVSTHAFLGFPGHRAIRCGYCKPAGRDCLGCEKQCGVDPGSSPLRSVARCRSDDESPAKQV